jgi:AcrR family transcriptional regulator
VAVYGGQGDSERSMRLLWEDQGPTERPRPGPKPALRLDDIVTAAVAVADADGLDGLSMRAVGERLGRTAMALYTYVPGKGELLDLMYDRVHAELRHDDAAPDWRAAVMAWARDLWALYLRHPWTLQVSYARPVLGPHEQAALETIARILERTSLPDDLRRRVIGTLFHFTRGAAQTVAESRHATARTGVADQEWWAARAPALHRVAPDFAERFPASIRLGGSAPAEGEPYLEREGTAMFETGLTVLLDGVEATIAGA